MGNGNDFLDSLRMVNTEARMRLPEANIVRSTRSFIDQGNNTGSKLGLGTREERREIRRDALGLDRKNGSNIDRLTGQSMMFGPSLGLNR